MNFRQLTCALALSTAMTAAAQGNIMEINTKKVGAPVQPTMYGMFFEDINYAADGGLYGEKVKNRSFEFPQNLMGWQTFGNVELKNDGPFERCPHYVVLSDAKHGDRRSGLTNEGYFGIGVIKGEEYRFTVWAKASKLSPVRWRVRRAASRPGALSMFMGQPSRARLVPWGRFSASK